MRVRQLFYPEYGTMIVVRPTHWWSRRERAAARIAARMLERHWERYSYELQRQVIQNTLYGPRHYG